MIFNSYAYLLFLPIVFVLYWILFKKSYQLQNQLVLLASYFFYGWWSWRFLCLLLLCTALDFAYGFGVASKNKRKAKLFLWLGLLNNLGILIVFKYYNFFILETQSALAQLGCYFQPILLKVALPIGISFYTFHGLSYIIDIYRRKQKPVKNVVDYALFVSFFPLLVAGPIERAHHLLPQIQKSRFFNYKQAVEGCKLILWGLFKKVVIADSLAIMVNDIFVNYTDYNGLVLIIGALAFSFQIYGDFSGYSDIAMGSAKLLGFELLSNFNYPYFSRNLAEFWRRWHISLTTWFRDYLYIPLGGSQAGKLKTIRNILLIFLVSGFWHGANWNFLAWGVIHACGYGTIIFFNLHRKPLNEVVAQGHRFANIKELSQMTLTFVFVSFAWIFFRMSNVEAALSYLKRIQETLLIQPFSTNTIKVTIRTAVLIIPFISLEWFMRNSERSILDFKSPFRFVLYFLIFVLTMLHFGKQTTFLYFQF
jgi:D-alanyl-lipoteichoic acid acyltransferase DltB (MBOAT superfamily)